MNAELSEFWAGLVAAFFAAGWWWMLVPGVLGALLVLWLFLEINPERMTRRPRVCPRCHGEREAWDGDPCHGGTAYVRCPCCRGRGEIE